MKLLMDDTPLGRARLGYFMTNRGPWSELDEDQPFLPGVGKKPQGANFYPANATRDEIDAWMKSLPEAQRTAATGFFTTIRRTPDGKLAAVPYSVEYQGELAEMSRLLKEAGAPATHGQGRDRQEAGTQHVRHVPRIDVPHAALRTE